MLITKKRITKKRIATLSLLSLLSLPLSAQAPPPAPASDEATHNELRALRDGLLDAMRKGDIERGAKDAQSIVDADTEQMLKHEREKQENPNSDRHNRHKSADEPAKPPAEPPKTAAPASAHDRGAHPK